MTIYPRIIVAMIAMFVALTSMAIENVKIHGKVTDQAGDPVEFVTVRIGGTAIGTNTGLQGEYSLSTAKADTITVHFSCIGYKEEKRVLLDASGDVTVNMRMMPSTVELAEVEVTEIRRQTSSMVSVDREKMKLSPDVSGGSVEALITTMAGVNSSNEMSSQYSVRGGSYDENSVYINGIEVYRPLLI